MAATILNYLEGEARDSRGRLITEIWSQDDWYWEQTHDFIQWLFPLNEKSRAVGNTPILNDTDIRIIRDSETAVLNLAKSSERYKEFLQRTDKWQAPYNHNHLRITRVIKSLRLLADDDSANGFKYWIATQLGDGIDRINAESRRFWRLA